MRVRAAEKPGNVWLAGKLFKGAEVVSTPTLLAHVNETASIKVGDAAGLFSMSMTVVPQP